MTSAPHCLEIGDREITTAISQLLEDEVGLNPQEHGLTGVSLTIRSKPLQHFSLVQSTLTDASIPSLQTLNAVAFQAFKPLGIHIGATEHQCD